MQLFSRDIKCQLSIHLLKLSAFIVYQFQTHSSEKVHIFVIVLAYLKFWAWSKMKNYLNNKRYLNTFKTFWTRAKSFWTSRYISGLLLSQLILFFLNVNCYQRLLFYECQFLSEITFFFECQFLSKIILSLGRQRKTECIKWQTLNFIISSNSIGLGFEKFDDFV